MVQSPLGLCEFSVVWYVLFSIAIRYCFRRADCEKAAGRLQSAGIEAGAYHAGMPDRERKHGLFVIGLEHLVNRSSGEARHVFNKTSYFSGRSRLFTSRLVLSSCCVER